MQRFLVKTFGCRASQADGAALEAGLAGRGLSAASDVAEADVVVLNTCTVTATADDELRQVVRRIHRTRPEARIVVTGCYAQRAPEELAKLPGVEWVVGNSHKVEIPDLVASAAGHGLAHFGDEALLDAPAFHGEVRVGRAESRGLITSDSIKPDAIQQGLIRVGEIGREFLAAPVEDALGDRTRPNLKVQDGCSNACSFCIIPSVRGRSRSAPADDVVAQVKTLGAKYREVVLSGINLGRWGRDFTGAGLRLADLVRRLLDETPVERLRLSSVEPMDFSDALLELMATSGRIAKHVHAPLQSGSDTVLRRMHRKYRPRHYADRIAKARELMPDCAVGADVMTGFPGETDAEFEDSRAFIASLPFTYLHVFTYSARPGTPAAEAPHQVPMEVRKQRTHVLRALAAEKNRAFRESFVGRRLSVVTIDGASAGNDASATTSALSDNYLKVQLARPRAANRMEQITIGGLTADGLYEAGVLPVLPS